MTEFDKVIPPGGVGKVTASLDTSHYTGPIAKVVQVTTTPGTAGSPVLLQLKAQIVSLIEVRPTENPVIRATVGEPARVELTVAATDGKPFDVLAVQADPSVEVTVRPDGGRPAAKRAKRSHGRALAAGSSRYLLTIVPNPAAPLGQSIANVTLRTNRPKAETVSIRALVVVAGAVGVAPPQLLLRPGLDPPVLHVRITKPRGAALQILGVDAGDPEFTATTTAIAPGREYDVTVTYTGKPGRGVVTSRITVKTNQPGQDTIVIPLAGRI